MRVGLAALSRTKPTVTKDRPTVELSENGAEDFAVARMMDADELHSLLG
jgi:hypothetical protein